MVRCVQLSCGGWYVIPPDDPLDHPAPTTPSTSSSILPPCSLNLKARMPKGTNITLSEYAVKLHPFIKPENTAKSWPKVLLTLMNDDNFPNLSSIVDNIYHALMAPPPQLKTLIECCDYYITMLPTIINFLPGDVRSFLLNFKTKDYGHQDESEEKATIFSERQSENQTKSYLHHLLAFLYTKKCPILDSYLNHIKSDDWVSVEDSYQYAFFSSIVYDLSRETPRRFGATTWLTLHAQIYCFERKDRGSGVALNGSGWASQKLSAALYAIRACICGKMLTTTSSTESPGFTEAVDMALGLQASNFANTISPWIRHLRNDYAEEPNSRSIRVGWNGDIFIDGVCFRRSIYESLIPKVYRLFYSIFEDHIDGEDWKEVLNLRLPVGMRNWNECEYAVGSCNSTDIILKKDVDTHVMQKLCALIEFSLLGLGLAPGRFQEVCRLDVTMFKWYHCLYYGFVSRKKGSYKSAAGKFIEHRLPPCLERCLLLFRAIVQKHARYAPQGKQLLPTMPSTRAYSVIHLAKEIFGITSTSLNIFHIRHFFHTTINILFPDGASEYGVLVASPQISTRAGHSFQTTTRNYATHWDNWQDRYYEEYFNFMGDKDMSHPNYIPSEPFNRTEMLHVIQHLYGENATFRNKEQEEALEAVVNGRQHLLALLSCGGGKTLLALMPTLLAMHRGYHSPMTIIIDPHISLVGHHGGQLEELTKRWDTGRIIWIKELSGGGKLDDELKGDILPHILILSLGAAAALIRDSFDLLRKWAGDNTLGNIIIDELQVVGEEIGLRSSEYLQLQKLAALNVPITCLSGSLTQPIATEFCKFLRLNPFDDIKTIKSREIIGDHISFEVIEKDTNDIDVVAEYALSRVDDSEDSCQVHIICSTKVTAKAIFNRLASPTKHSISLVHGDMDSLEKEEAAKNWRENKTDIYITTTCALEGNENSNCRHVMIVDQIYSLSNLIQAIGRIRAEQAKDGKAFITQFLSKEDMDETSKRCQDTTKSKIGCLVNNGLIPEHDQLIHSEAAATFSEEGYIQLFKAKGCLLKSLRNCFDCPSDSDCQRCTNCDYYYGTSNARIDDVSTERCFPSFLQPTPIEGEEGDDSMDTLGEVTTSDAQEDDVFRRPRMQRPRLQKAAQRAVQDKGSQSQERRAYESPPPNKRPKTHNTLPQPTKSVQTASALAIEEGRKQEEYMRLAQRNLQYMKDGYCICGDKGTCDGRCQRGNRCFKCFGPHSHTACPLWKNGSWTKEFQSLLQAKACYNCFDPYCQSTNNEHEVKDRIKAALVRDGRKRGQGLLEVVRCHYANENSMHQFLSKIWGENVRFINE